MSSVSKNIVAKIYLLSLFVKPFLYLIYYIIIWLTWSDPDPTIQKVVNGFSYYIFSNSFLLKVYISVVGFLYVFKVLTLLMVMAKEKFD